MCPLRVRAQEPPRTVTVSQENVSADLQVSQARRCTPIWAAETSPARERRYRDLLAAALPPGYYAQPGSRDRGLWRTLHAAELAGLDPAQVLSDAVAERDLAGARDIPAVLDAHIRNRAGSLVPLPPGPWSARVPAITDPERRAYLTQIAVLMDARKKRLGERAAACAPWPPSARPTARTCAGCRTGCCCTCAIPIPSRPPGRPSTSGMSSARSATLFAAVMADRTEWEAATRQQRHLAVAADAELRHRHPCQYYAPLRSAEPAPATSAQRAELTLTAGEKTTQIGQWLEDLGARRRTFAERLADRQSQTVPSEDPTTAISARHFPPGPGRERVPSCSRPNPRSRRPRRSSSA